VEYFNQKYQRIGKSGNCSERVLAIRFLGRFHPLRNDICCRLARLFTQERPMAGGRNLNLDNSTQNV
jgi:hypothetical protein